MRANHELGSAGGGIDERSVDRSGGVELIAAQRGSVDYVCRIRPEDDWGGLVDGQQYGLGRGGVVGGVSWSEGNRESVGACQRNGSCCRSVDQSAGDRCSCIQLGVAERGAIDNARRCCPCDDWGGLVDGELHRLGCRRVVRGVGRCEDDREGVSAGGGYAACGWSVSERAWNRGRCVELGGGQHRSIGGGGRRGRCDYRRCLVNNNLYGLGG